MTEKKKTTEDASERLSVAERDWRRLKTEIAPFVKPRDRRQYSTAGQWQDTRTAATQPTSRTQAGKAPK